MVKKEKKRRIKGLKNAFFVEDYYEDEPISKKIFSSINDFYNLMHLIKKSWLNKKYHLRMENMGYNIYDESNDLSAWIGIKEKWRSIVFIIYTWGKLYGNAYKEFNEPMVIYNFDEDLWIYSELQISDILEEKSFEAQRKITINWIENKINKIL